MSYNLFYDKTQFWMFKLPKNTKNGGNKAKKYIIIYLSTITQNLWRLEGPRIDIAAVVFERVNMFFNLGAGNVNLAGSFLD